MIKKIRSIFLLLSLGLVFGACEKDENSNSTGSIEGTLEPNQLSEVLVVPGGTVVSGNMPAPTGGAQSPGLVMVDSTVSWSAGGQVRLPVEFNSTSGVSGIRFQVNGANRHIDVPVTGGSSGVMLLPIGIPSNTPAGDFCITITVYDLNGNVSNSFETCITVTKPQGCNVTRVSGGEGITSTLHDMGSNPGAVKIEYETYTVPDRIDVYYNGVWVAGTGSDPGPIGVPPLADCNNPTDGYIGENGTFCFTYDPTMMGKKAEKMVKLGKKAGLQMYKSSAESHLVEVVVSGCVRGGTRWEYEISCADPNEECLRGQEGSPRFNLQFDGDVDFDLYVKDPSGETVSYSNTTSASGGQLDVDCICCEHGNENIYWESGTAHSGQYEYWVDFFSECSDSNSDFTITVTRNGNEVETRTGRLENVGDESTRWTYNHF